MIKHQRQSLAIPHFPIPSSIFAVQYHSIETKNSLNQSQVFTGNLLLEGRLGQVDDIAGQDRGEVRKGGYECEGEFWRELHGAFGKDERKKVE